MAEIESITLKPIGIFHSEYNQPYDLPRQPDEKSQLAYIKLFDKNNFEQALQNLDSFDRIWVIYQFHHNDHWNPMTLPPRGSSKKLGVFSTRSPYRPNPIGLSCLKLLKIDGLKLWVTGADLMDQSPILDIKPYLPAHDSFPDASMGWLKDVEKNKYSISFNDISDKKIRWLRENGEEKIYTFILRQLDFDPVNSDKKRVSIQKSSLDPHNLTTETIYTLAYRTWRIEFKINTNDLTVEIQNILSGYSSDELNSNTDPYADKALHRQFINLIL